MKFESSAYVYLHICYSTMLVLMSEQTLVPADIGSQRLIKVFQLFSSVWVFLPYSVFS